MKFEYLFDWLMCYIAPFALGIAFTPTVGFLYAFCTMTFALIRIGNKLRGNSL